MKKLILFSFFSFGFLSAQSYPPQAGEVGSTAIYKESSLFVSWATGITVERGFINKSNPDFTIMGNNKASSGNPTDALGFPDGYTVSLGDEGMATLTFAAPIINGSGFDFAVFENGGATYLELAFVEVSSDGINFFRFAAHSQTQTATQIAAFGTPSANYLNNLAGKYSGTFGTPFDLAELPESDLLDKNNVTHVRIIDVVGSVDPQFATFDSFGNAVNDSFPTPFQSCGFDLQAVGVINQQTLSLVDYEKLQINVYPNPASEKIYLSGVFNAYVKIYDAQGRNVLHHKYTDGIDVRDLNKGIYLVEISSETSKKSFQKIVIR